jgi:hypothetical protein
MTQPKWQFASRFRRHAFGWRSEVPIQRIKEAVAEIKAVAKSDPELAAEGAVKFLEKLSPALEQVDSSSGALGGAVNRAIDSLVPVIAAPAVERRIRQRWLERLFAAVQDDQVPYLDCLGDHWGSLCATPQLASAWADDLLPTLRNVWHPDSPPHGYFPGTTACLSALATAGRYHELLEILKLAPIRSWAYGQWGVQALVAQGRQDDAIAFAEAIRSRNEPNAVISRACEEILLASGLVEEAYRRYAIEANASTTNLATFRAIAKKYSHKSQTDILRDLVASQPGATGKWFAAAKDAGLYDLALELASISPPDHRTLVRAARDFAASRPDFAVACGLMALRWISRGHGYDITGTDILDAYGAITQALPGSQTDFQAVHRQIGEMTEGDQPYRKLLRAVLGDSTLSV